MSKRRSIIYIFGLIISLLIGYFSIKPAYKRLSDYLSKTERVDANILIVEGWLPEYLFESVKSEFIKNNYEYIITTGVSRNPLDHEHMPGFLSYAELSRERLILIGIDSSRIKAVPATFVSINRTLSSAMATAMWLKNSNLKIHGINIISEGPHARRTWYIYSRILKKSCDIGIISLPANPHYHSREERSVNTVRETIAIIYYWFLLLFY